MRNCRDKHEPMCETSELGERLLTRADLQVTAFDIGERILSLFGYQKLSSIVFRLRISSRELTDVLEGEEMPSVEMLLGIQRMTGASIDWILTGEGGRFVPTTKTKNSKQEEMVTFVQLPPRRERRPQLW